jgi:3-oxoacyl-[acyl-carrier-protein] synthase III
VNPTIRAGILGTGSYLPEKIMTNRELEKIVDTSDEWIITRTGIRERHISRPDENTSDMAAEAAKKALAQCGIKASDLELIIVATISPDMPTPSTACLVQQKLGAPQAAAFDLSAACSGFVYGLSVAKAFVESGLYRHILLIGAEKLTSFVDWQDRTTCVLFGDGAGAAVIGPVPEDGHRILGTFLAANGCEADLLKIPGGGSRTPASEQSLKDRAHYLKMQGKEIFKIGVKVMASSSLKVLEDAGLTLEQVSLVILHQANLRIIQAVGEKLGLPQEKLYINVDHVGNTSAASIIIALDEAIQKGRIKKGDTIVLAAVGAGTTFASALVRW